MSSYIGLVHSYLTFDNRMCLSIVDQKGNQRQENTFA